MSPTLVRIISAVVAVLLLIVSYHFFQTMGVLVVASFVVIGVQAEFVKLMFDKSNFRYLEYFYFFLAASGFLIGLFYPSSLLILSGIIFILSVALVFFTSPDQSLDDLFETVGKVGLGIPYIIILPVLAVGPLAQTGGQEFFFSLMAIVFTGDAFAYFAGKFFGKKKLWEAVSPKKTWAGGWGGLLGSVLAGLVSHYVWLPQIPLYVLLPVSLTTGFLGQVGDFFESLVKRVTGVKDSGQIMPGHGGFMDRVDGIIFGAPPIYIIFKLFGS